MNDHLIEIREYLTKQGVSPFAAWTRKLKDIKARARIRIRIDRIRLGNFGDCKGIGSGVQELRIDYGPGYRIYFGREGDIVVILLIGGTKQKQSQDIKRAQEYWSDYKGRKNE